MHCFLTMSCSIMLPSGNSNTHYKCLPLLPTCHLPLTLFMCMKIKKKLSNEQKSQWQVSINKSDLEMMHFKMQLLLMWGSSKADPDSRLEASTDDFFEWFQHHHWLTAVIHLLQWPVTDSHLLTITDNYILTIIMNYFLHRLYILKTG